MKKIILIFVLIILSHFNLSAEEIRIGVLNHDLGAKLKQRYEKGLNIHFEYLVNKQYTLLYALPHFGISVNSQNYTSSLYAGLVWSLESSNFPIFLEGTFGGAIHNGELKKSRKRRGLGSKLLFRESLSLGVKLAEQHKFSLIVDHMSNASLVLPNPGLTDIGIRYGYKF